MRFVCYGEGGEKVELRIDRENLGVYFEVVEGDNIVFLR